MPLVFVYGTLKRGDTNHHHLAGQVFLGEVRTVAGYTLYQPADYPGMVRSANAPTGVTGELWEVTPECLRDLDRLEGVAEGLYERVPVQLGPPHANLPVETYLYLRSLEGSRHLGATWPGPASR